MSRVSIRPRGSKTPRGGRTPRSPSENMVAEARETERMAAAGAVNAEADSSRARATMAADCMISKEVCANGGKAVSTRIGRGGRAGGRSRCGGCSAPTPCDVRCAGAVRAANSGGSGGGKRNEGSCVGATWR